MQKLKGMKVIDTLETLKQRFGIEANALAYLLGWLEGGTEAADKQIREDCRGFFRQIERINLKPNRK